MPRPGLAHYPDPDGGCSDTGARRNGRVFFDLQQEYFGWLTEARNDAGHIVPSFQNQIKLITSYRASALPAMPTFWYGMFKEIQPSDEKKPTNTSPARAGSQSTVNSHADSGLLTRFKDSGFTSISAMTKDKDITIPKGTAKMTM